MVGPISFETNKSNRCTAKLMLYVTECLKFNLSRNHETYERLCEK